MEGGCGNRLRPAPSAIDGNIRSTMAHAQYLREKARSMRIERQFTIDELAERLALSRSTVYYWVRDLPIPGSGSGGEWPEAARRKGTLAMQRKYRLLREEAYREGQESFDGLAIDPTFRDFICLYIAEGYKRNRNRAAIANSDPAVVGFATRWIRRLTDTSPTFAVQVPRRSGSERAPRFLGQHARGRSQHDQTTTQVEQQSAGRTHLAFRSRRSHRLRRRHVVSRAPAGVD